MSAYSCLDMAGYELMEKVEVTIFTEHFTSGNLQKAIAALRPMQQTTSQGVTCLLGTLTVLFHLVQCHTYFCL